MTNDWQALAREVRRRRVRLGMHQADLEEIGGPSCGTIRNVEQAVRDNYALRTYVQLEAALKWGDGVVRKILDGTATPDDLAGNGFYELAAGNPRVADEHALEVGRLVLALVEALQRPG